MSRLYPIGIQSFEKIREGGYVYVDKTAWIYRLITGGNYYFLSRPRRFGKSLLISTLEAYFQGKKELFEGLSIGRLEREWMKYPVFYLDLNAQKYESVQDLANMLNMALTRWEKLYGKEDSETSPSLRFQGVIRRASETMGCKVAILVDEYDKPLLQTIGNEVLQTEYRNTLKAFYGVLKSCDQYIRFALLTGVTKFNKVSVFSDLNNLRDISMLREYENICGISEEELYRDFVPDVEALAEAGGVQLEDTYKRLKEWYDGYHFTPDGADIYNPFSLLNTFANREFGSYWFETGTPTFLVTMLKESRYNLQRLTGEVAMADSLQGINSMSNNPVPYLYQSGYLTIKGIIENFKYMNWDFQIRKWKRVLPSFCFLVTRIWIRGIRPLN